MLGARHRGRRGLDRTRRQVSFHLAPSNRHRGRRQPRARALSQGRTRGLPRPITRALRIPASGSAPDRVTRESWEPPSSIPFYPPAGATDASSSAASGLVPGGRAKPGAETAALPSPKKPSPRSPGPPVTAALARRRASAAGTPCCITGASSRAPDGEAHPSVGGIVGGTGRAFQARLTQSKPTPAVSDPAVVAHHRPRCHQAGVRGHRRARLTHGPSLHRVP